MFSLFYSDKQICLMQKFQTDPTLYHVDKQTKRQVFQANVHNFLSPQFVFYL